MASKLTEMFSHGRLVFSVLTGYDVCRRHCCNGRKTNILHP